MVYIVWGRQKSLPKRKKKVEPRRDGKHGSMVAASTARRVKDEPGKKRWRKIPGEERRECR